MVALLAVILVGQLLGIIELRLQTVPEPGSVLGFFLLGVWGLGSKRQRKKS
jgi:hypothetical protein